MSVIASADRHPRARATALYGSAALVTLFCWAMALPAEGPDTVADIVALKVFLDLVLGFSALALLPLRRRFPFTVAASTSLLLVFSAAATGAWGVATISFAKNRRVGQSAVILFLATAASMASLWWMPDVTGEDQVPWWALLIVIVLVYLLVIAVGFYLGARRDLVRSWQERAETAEREQATRTARARVAERTRIAREMHDVLAHRISTVAMHSGALAYRADLEPDQVRDTARLIQESAHSALVELRDILGVLREDAPDEVERTPEPPQPTIADLGDLVADAVRAGQEVELTLDVDAGAIPDALGRHVYRSVQECLTNARKHSPGAPVTVRVARSSARRDADLVVEVSNPLATESASRRQDLPLPGTVGVGFEAPSSGVGLLGLAERADLAGGRLEHGPHDHRYVTRLIVPWPERRIA